MSSPNLIQLWTHEFRGYTRTAFSADLLAGLTVSAVALPLALAYGVASGASALAGLVSAILAGLVAGALAGAPYQVSGPTAAMTAVLAVTAQKFGLPSMFVAGFFAGLLLLLIGLLRLGRLIAYVPGPVITGFTGGIAVIIAVGQLDNLLGVSTPAAPSTLLKLTGYLQGGFSPSPRALALGALVIFTMLAWPSRWQARIPSSLVGLALATAAGSLLGWPVATVGDIPHTLLPPHHLSLAQLSLASLTQLAGPILSLTALGMIESLLSGAVGSNLTHVRLHANQELIAQGVSNLVIPFFGGITSAAGIVRSSVGIKSGGRTRLTSIVHALAMLATVFVLAPVMSRIPLAALAGLLLVTAWRMIEWDAVRFLIRHRFQFSLTALFLTLLGTLVLDLTQAVLVGVFFSGAIFLSQIANLTIDVQKVDPARLDGYPAVDACRLEHIRVAYLTGPLFFAAVGHLNEALAALDLRVHLILSMRGVPLIDTTGAEALLAWVERIQAAGGRVMLVGLQPAVTNLLAKAEILHRIGPENIFWSADQAILAAARCPDPPTLDPLAEPGLLEQV